MLGWWHRRKTFREQVTRAADELMAQHGCLAYETARQHRIRTLTADHKEHRFWCAVASEIARRRGHVVGLDTATRYLEYPLPNVTSQPEIVLEPLDRRNGVSPSRPPAANRSHLRLVPKA